MATAPLVVFLYDRTFLAGSFVRALRMRWRMYAGLFATWLILVALHGGRGASAGFGGPVGVWEYALTQFRFIPLYLRLSIWPRPLVFDYGTPLVGSVREVWPGALLMIALIAATVSALRFRPMLGFLGACVFVILAPSSSIIPISTQTGAEHRMYLPLAAVVAAVVLAGYQIAATAFGRSRRYTGAAIIAAAAILLGLATYNRNNDYRTWQTIWTDTIAKVPENPRAYHNLALHYFRAGQYVEAVEQSRVTVRLQSDFPDGYLNLANGEAALGRHEEAIADFSRAIQVAPKKAAAYFNRGNSSFALGRFDKAIEDYGGAIARDAGHAEAYYSRGVALERVHRPEEALSSFSEAIRLRPDYLAAFGERALCYYLLKRYDEAWADVRAFQRLGGSPNAGFIERLSRAKGPPS
jgi:protein O-mannosyl-transferase